MRSVPPRTCYMVMVKAAGMLSTVIWSIILELSTAPHLYHDGMETWLYAGCVLINYWTRTWRDRIQLFTKFSRYISFSCNLSIAIALHSYDIYINFSCIVSIAITLHSCYIYISFSCNSSIAIALHFCNMYINFNCNLSIAITLRSYDIFLSTSDVILSVAVMVPYILVIFISFSAVLLSPWILVYVHHAKWSLALSLAYGSSLVNSYCFVIIYIYGKSHLTCILLICHNDIDFDNEMCYVFTDMKTIRRHPALQLN